MFHRLDYLRETSFALLQGSRMRNTKTEFVSCPSCGRTLFDLQEVTAQISERTGHLPGVAIAIMGCIVNGPGEMADADFGYVGGAPGKVDLYVGKTVVKKSIPNDDACDALVVQGVKLIGVLTWAIELGHLDILYEVSCLSSTLALPQVGHKDAFYNIFRYLSKHLDSVLVLDDLDVVR